MVWLYQPLLHLTAISSLIRCRLRDQGSTNNEEKVMDKHRTSARTLLPAALLLSAWALAQPSGYSFVFEVYMQSALEPDSFDSWFEENRARFDQQFSSCFRTLYSQWQQQAAADAEICDQHDDSNWKAKCHSESRAEHYFLWAKDMRQVLSAGEGWVDTFTGSGMARAWVQCRQVPGLCATMKAQLEENLVGYRPDMTCH
jgi:hypothetical protein